MSNPEAKDSKAVDWLEPWREMRNGYMDAWAKAMSGAVNTDAYSQFNGLMLDTYLTTSAPFREAQKKMMLSTLEQMQMPSRSDFVSMAERLANLELLLDDMSAKLSEITKALSDAVPAPKAGAEAPKAEAEAPKAEAEAPKAEAEAPKAEAEAPQSGSEAPKPEAEASQSELKDRSVQPMGPKTGSKLPIRRNPVRTDEKGSK